VNVFTSAQTLSRDHFFQYDEPIDEINDISAVQIALHQRWQTKRGGPGRWRSVDFFTLNVEANFFMKPTARQRAGSGHLPRALLQQPARGVAAAQQHQPPTPPGA